MDQHPTRSSSHRPLRERPALAALALAVSAALLLGACSRRTPDELVAAAQRHLQASDDAAAQIELRNAIKAAPEHVLAHELLGAALLRLGDAASAEMAFRRALALGAAADRVVPPLATAMLRNGNAQRLIEELGGKELVEPGSRAALKAAVGHAWLARGETAPASAAFSAALAIQPGHASATLGMARLAVLDQRAQEALELTDSALKSDPRLVEAHTFRGQLLAAAGQQAPAREALGQALAVDAAYLPARLALASLLMDGKDVAGAAQLLDAAGRASGDPRVKQLRGQIALREGNLPAARDAVGAALQAAPGFGPAVVLAGEIELRAGNFSAAEEYFGQVLTQQADPALRRLLATAQLRQGRAAKALRTLEPLLQGGNKGADPAVLLLAGEAHLANGDIARAALCFEAATGAQNTEAAARTRLGQLALRGGDFQRGEEQLLAASGQAAQTIEPDILLVSMYLRRQETDKALAAARNLVKKQPRNPLGHVLAGTALAARQQRGEARQSFQAALQLQADHLPALRALAELDEEEGRPGDALARYEALLAGRPRDEQLLLAVAALQERTGRGDVEATLRKALAAAPGAREPVAALVQHHLRLRRPAAALEVAKAASMERPEDAELALLLASAQEAAGAPRDALRTLSTAALNAPNTVEPLRRLARLQARQRDFDGAVTTLARAHEKMPANLAVSRDMAGVHLQAGRTDRALQVARDLQARPQHAAVGHALEGDVLALSRRWREAERAYRAALAADPEAGEAAAQLYRMLYAQGRGGDADGLAAQWIARHPTDATMRLLAADAAQRSGRLPAAIAQYEAVLKADPRQPLVLVSLASALAEAKDPRAITLAERAAAMEPRNPDVLDTLGRLHLQSGDSAKGLVALQRVREIAPERADLRLNYAKGLLRSGRTQEGKAELRDITLVEAEFPGKAEARALLQGL